MEYFDYKSKYGTMYKDCYFNVGHYENGNIAIEIWNNTDGPITRLTVNPDIPLPSDRLAIKNYSENEGMVDWLVMNGIVENNPVKEIYQGWISIPVHKLTEYGLRILELDNIKF